MRNQPVVGIQRKLPRMLHDSPGSKGNSSPITTVDVVRKNPECIALSNQDPGPVIHEVTEYEVEDPLSVGSASVKSPASSRSCLKSPSPNIVTLSPSASIASHENDHGNLAQECPPLDKSTLSSPVDSSIPLEPLSILEPLQSGTLNEDDEESVLGIPLEYITASDIAKTYQSSSSNSAVSVPDQNKTVTSIKSLLPKRNDLKYIGAKKNMKNNIISIPDRSNLSSVLTIPQRSDISNVISIPESGAISNVISIPEGSNISNVISIPEGSNISNVISIPEGSNISNVISIPEGSDISSIISIPEGSEISDIIKISDNKNSKNISHSKKTSNIPSVTSNNSSTEKKSNALTFSDFYDSAVCLEDLKANGSLNPSDSSLTKQGYIDPLMTASLNTPKISLSDDMDLEQFSFGNNKLNKTSDTEFVSPLSITQREHDYPASVSDPNQAKSSSAKNTLSNHLLIVDEELNRLQDNIATNSWDVDVDKILGLFSSDGIVSNEAFVDQLTSGMDIKKESGDILDSELGQLTPQILGVELDDLRSPFLNHIDPEVVDSGDVGDPSKEEDPTGSLSNFSFSEYANNGNQPTNSPVRRRKNSKGSTVKRRKLK